MPTLFVPAPDVAALLAEDEARGPFPFRYGAVLPLAFDLVGEGAWDELEDGRLCVPFDAPVRSEQTYHLVCRPGGLEDARIVRSEFVDPIDQIERRDAVTIRISQ